MTKRIAVVERKTEETDIRVRLNLDGKGNYRVDTGIGFLNHMLSLFAKHGLFDLTVKAKGDLEVDYHHTVEDVGICLGEALRKALGKKVGIRRFGSAYAPMDESLALVVVDLSGRPFLVSLLPQKRAKADGFGIDLAEEFLRALSQKGGFALHINLLYGKNLHHILEAIFKALGLALDIATQIDPRMKGIPSTKGRL